MEYSRNGAALPDGSVPGLDHQLSVSKETAAASENGEESAKCLSLLIISHKGAEALLLRRYKPRRYLAIARESAAEYIRPNNNQNKKTSSPPADKTRNIRKRRLFNK